LLLVSSSGSTGPLKSISTITYPFYEDAGTVDPDIYYGPEGLMVTLNVYDRLITDTPVAAGVPIPYASVTRFRPALAHAWEVSADGLTYVFHLRSGVTFHDGTPMNAEAWRNCFVRRAKVNAGPAYQVAVVKSTEAPDDLTFVVKMKQPCNPFLPYMASPYGPQVISPTALEKHEVKGDLAQKWLVGHDCGTGPYMLTDYVPDTSYTLEAYPGYWGKAPEVRKANMPIVPDVQTQELGFKAGQYHFVKGLPVQTYESYSKNPDYIVKSWTLANTTGYEFNSAPGRVFADQNLRLAAASAIDKQLITKSAFGDYATVLTQFFPEGCFPDGLVTDDPPYDPSKLTEALKGVSNRKVDIAVGSFLGAPQEVAAELLEAEWQAAGLDVTLRTLSWAEYQSLNTAAEAQRPDVMITGLGGDTIQVATLLRIGLAPGGGLNEFSYDYPEGVKLMNEAIANPSPAGALRGYAESAAYYRNLGIVQNICSVPDIFVFRAGFTNFVHDAAAPEWVSLADLKLASS
jgi:peptide/nickel transport system substrate-binding protein